MSSSGTRLDPTLVQAAVEAAAEGLDLVPAEAGKVPESYLPDRLSEAGIGDQVQAMNVVIKDAGKVPEADLPDRLSPSSLTASIDAIAAPRAGVSVKDEDYGAAGNGTTNDAAAIQAAIDAARDAVRAGFALGAGMAFIPGGRYRLTSQIVQPPYVKVVPLAPVVILSEVPGDAAWWITPLSDDPSNLYAPLSKQQWTLGDLIDGSHGGITLINNDGGGAGTTRGLELGSRTDLTADKPLSRYTLGHIAIQGYHEGIRWNSYNHYIAHYNALKIELNDIAVQVSGPGTNSGENITFEQCLFASTTLTNPAIKIDAPNIDLNFEDCSADFVSTLFEINQGYGQITWDGGHLEGINENSRFSATGGIAVSNVTTASGQALPVVTIGPMVPLVASARGVRFRGEMYLSAGIQYRVQSSDYSTNQAPDKGVLCDDSVRLVERSLVLTRGGPLMQRGLNEVRDAALADAAGTLGSALTHWTRTNGGGTVTSVVATNAPVAGYQSLECTLAASSHMRWMPKAYSPCRPGDVIYGTFAYELEAGAPALTKSIMVAWYDSEKVQIETTAQTDLTTSVQTADEWRLPDGPVRLTPPPGAVFYKAGFQISTGASGNGTSKYWIGAPHFERRRA